ncbi:hypothetical protein J6590_036969 [Homalodisca vitripennis]|nr:hypothetical protein J6590_036969 [Homalodisca vitripennis]
MSKGPEVDTCLRESWAKQTLDGGKQGSGSAVPGQAINHPLPCSRLIHTLTMLMCFRLQFSRLVTLSATAAPHPRLSCRYVIATCHHTDHLRVIRVEHNAICSWRPQNGNLHLQLFVLYHKTPVCDTL